LPSRGRGSLAELAACPLFAELLERLTDGRARVDQLAAAELRRHLSNAGKQGRGASRCRPEQLSPVLGFDDAGAPQVFREFGDELAPRRGGLLLTARREREALALLALDGDTSGRTVVGPAELA
jgi:hypothetical protein